MEGIESRDETYGTERMFGMGRNDLMIAFLAGLGTGAALMYLLDPDRGRRRRALIRDKAIGLSNDAREAINATAEDLSNRAYGLAAEAGKAVTGKPIDAGESTDTSEALDAGGLTDTARAGGK